MFKDLIDWSRENFSKLPWRKKRTLYTTFVSEIMLQQTTVATVENHFEKFIKKYPNLKSLASSTEEDLLVAWKGLGYYRRAKNLRLAAMEMMEKNRGLFPKTHDELLEIHGIGPYTASAMMAIGRDQWSLAVDANLERVIARIYGLEEFKGPKLQKEIWKKFEQKKILKNARSFSAREVNEALMDLGRTLCQAGKTRCEVCFFKKSCRAHLSGDPLSYPRKALKDKDQTKKKYYDLVLLRVICHKNKKMAAIKKEKKQWLSGQYEVPTFIISSEDQSLNQYPVIPKKLKEHLDIDGPFFKSAITKYRITNYVLSISHTKFQKLGDFGDLEWLADDQLNQISTSSMKAMDKISC